MNKSFVVDSAYNNMRLDRYLRNKLGQIPQSLIEKNIRNGKIKLNRKKQKVQLKLDQMIKLNYLILNLRKIFIKLKRNLNQITLLLNKMKI